MIPPSHTAKTDHPIFLPVLMPFRGVFCEPPGRGAVVALTAPPSVAAGRS